MSSKQKVLAKANKKNKKMKKSESQARHQQLPKSELMTKHGHPDDSELLLGSDQGHSAYMQNLKLGSQLIDQSYMKNHSRAEPQQLTKRVSTRTP